MVLGEEQGHRHAVAAIDAHLVRQVAVFIAVEQPQIDARRVGLGDALQQRALLHTVAAPDAADDQHLHVAHETGDELLLCIRQLRRRLHLLPAPLLLLGAGVNVTVIRQSRREFLGQKRCVHDSSRSLETPDETGKLKALSPYEAGRPRRRVS